MMFFFSQNIFAQCGMMKMNHDKQEMKTTKQDTTIKDTTKIIYTCSMHPEIISDKSGICPKCGMDLVKVENGKTQSEQQMEMMMMCPMHGMVDMNHKHDEQKKDNKKTVKWMGIAMGAMMAVMIIVVGSH